MLYRHSRLHQPRSQRLRQGLIARGIVLALLAFLLVPLYRLQIRSAEEFSLQARQNRMRPMVVRAPRGTICGDPQIDFILDIGGGIDQHGVAGPAAEGPDLAVAPAPHEGFGRPPAS